MGARSVPPPPMVVRRVLHVAWPAVGVVATGVMAPVVVVGAFAVLLDRRARLFRAASLATVAMWVDIRMQLGIVGVVVLGLLYLAFVWRSWFFAVDRPRWDLRDDRPYSSLTL